MLELVEYFKRCNFFVRIVIANTLLRTRYYNLRGTVGRILSKLRIPTSGSLL